MHERWIKATFEGDLSEIIQAGVPDDYNPGDHALIVELRDVLMHLLSHLGNLSYSIVEEFMILLFQVFGEVLLQILGSGMVDGLTWVWEADDTPRSRGCALLLVMIALGGLLGWLTVYLVPHTMLPWGWLRMMNLITGPLSSSWVSWKVAHVRKAHGQDTDPRLHALIAGSACFGIVVVRFALCVR